MGIVTKLAPCLALLMFGLIVVPAQRTGLNDDEIRYIKDFEGKAKDYVRRREDAARSITKVPANATPEQIEAYKKSLQQALLAARRNARQNQFFDRKMYSLIRRLVLTEFSGFKASEERQEVLAAANKGVKLRINAIYPETQELVMMPPTLLLTLPQLPPELRYRFVGRSLLLMDRDAALILDFMPNALP
jgi:hypothetical protein